MKLLKKKKIKSFNFLYFIINLIKIFLYKKIYYNYYNNIII